MVKKVAPEVKLDLGTGKGANRPEGFIGVDITKHPGVKVVTDLRKKWPWASDSVDEVYSNYLLHYLTGEERIHFANELYRVLKPTGKAQIIVPYWAANKAYGDPTAPMPPVVESWCFVLSREWRDAQNCDVPGYNCDFDHAVGYGLHPMISSRNQEYQQHAVSFWKEAAQELVLNLTPKK